MDDTHSGTTLKIQHVRLEATPVLIVAGEIDLSTADQLRSSLEPLSGRVVVHLHGVTFLDSTGIAVLVSARKRLVQNGGTLRLRAPQEHVRRVLEIVGLADWVIDAGHDGTGLAG